MVKRWRLRTFSTSPAFAARYIALNWAGHRFAPVQTPPSAPSSTASPIASSGPMNKEKPSLGKGAGPPEAPSVPTTRRNLLKSAMMELESFMATMFGCAASFAIVAGSMIVSVWAGMS